MLEPLRNLALRTVVPWNLAIRNLAGPLQPTGGGSPTKPDLPTDGNIPVYKPLTNHLMVAIHPDMTHSLTLALRPR